jgi:hypothetical protein
MEQGIQPPYPQMSLETFMNVDNISLILLPVINNMYLSEQKLKCLWSFGCRLMRAMLDQNLLDKQYVLESLIDMFEKIVGGLVTAQPQQRVSAAAAAAAAQANSAAAFDSHAFKLILTTSI